MAFSNALLALGDAEADALFAINEVLTRAELTPLQKQNPEAALALSNLAAPGARKVEGGTKVSVIMPAYNAASTIALAINSLQAQTWSNLEILVVDDCSDDETVAIVRDLARADWRVRLLEQPSNQGAYAARNAGLAQAVGDFITVHDADDWSHPQKTERQLRAMQERPELIATISDWARVREDMTFTGTFRAHGSLVSENTSSLLFRRRAIDDIGGWHLARTSADSEYVMRLRAYYGKEAVARIGKGVPVAFALDQETSLTRTSATHAKTLFYGPRREYRESASAWHASAEPNDLKVPLGENRQPFPIPQVMRVNRPEAPAHYDIVFICDFNLGGGAYVSSMHYVNAAIRAGKKVALFHYRRFDLDVKARLRPELRDQARAGRFDLLTVGDNVTAELVLATYPVVLQHPLDAVPSIQSSRFAILVNQMAARLTTGEDPQYDPRTIIANVETLFGVIPQWLPISGYVHKLIWEDVRYPLPSDNIWNPLLDVSDWCNQRVHWRGAEREQPVLGRHSRDHYTKWPQTAEALAAAYGVGKPCQVRLLGGADHAVGVLGGLPDNWRVMPFTDDVRDFIAQLDFFIHYPHEEYIEEFGRAVLEAMGLGVVPILPPVFKATFGDAAIYAPADQVWAQVEWLWHNRQAYTAASDKALAFVKQYADYSVLPGRLETLMKDVPYGVSA
nr:glycosyltransferase [Gilvimarinus xylanilyticus]